MSIFCACKHAIELLESPLQFANCSFNIDASEIACKLQFGCISFDDEFMLLLLLLFLGRGIKIIGCCFWDKLCRQQTANKLVDADEHYCDAISISSHKNVVLFFTCQKLVLSVKSCGLLLIRIQVARSMPKNLQPKSCDTNKSQIRAVVCKKPRNLPKK